MAASAYSGSGRSGRGRGRYRPMAEINVTPLVDVMLVLLVVFMVTAPLLTVGVPVDLPETSAPAINEPKEPLTISVNAKGEIFLQNTKVTADELIPRLNAITNQGYEERIYVRGDRSVSYGQMMRVMGALSGAGFKHVALVTEVEQGS
jgi:biopolymer transport protein TolR